MFGEISYALVGTTDIRKIIFLQATVELLLFGKESLVDLDIDQIAAESMWM